jgi:hypothetical protein
MAKTVYQSALLSAYTSTHKPALDEALEAARCKWRVIVTHKQSVRAAGTAKAMLPRSEIGLNLCYHLRRNNDRATPATLTQDT